MLFLTGLPLTTDALYDLLMMPVLVDPLSTRPLMDLLLLSQTAVSPGTESSEAFFMAVLGSSEEGRVKWLVSIA